jgi:acyl-CoA thioester hydrolase
MGSKTKYFEVENDAPAPLVTRTERRVRFEEVDLLGMVWHGRYPSYFEDGRIAFGDKYGMTYHRFIEEKTVAPVVQMHFDYKQPLHFDETFVIETSLHWAESARLNFSYKLLNSQGNVVASGYTVQLFTNPEGEMLLLTPQWLKDFQRNWKDGLWQE